ncbi:Vestitone reductase [Hibiscus syriacus]|uniref:Vestitone reductase n=1 Tax=Hibiscus syriacus TaxID=106335 RepID=A0A6A2X6Z2_HIBSY|nr:Vestitone reductase [Hibiscus syriacus]
MEDVKGTVCVTGGTEFIASMLIKRLLEEGYSVRTTARPDTENKRDLSFVTNLPGAAEKLKIFGADLNDPHSFDAAIKGSKGVFLVATPVDFQNKEPQEIVTEREISGTLGILKSCLKSKTVKRVVYTSSLATVVHNGQDSDMMDESFWSDVDFIREKETPNFSSYSISKTLTERAALEFVAEHGVDVVTLIPGLFVGPFICPKFPGSVHISLALLLGGKYPQFPISTPESLAEIKGNKGMKEDAFKLIQIRA